MCAIGIMMCVQESWSFSNTTGDTRHGRLRKENIIIGGKFKELQKLGSITFTYMYTQNDPNVIIVTEHFTILSKSVLTTRALV